MPQTEGMRVQLKLVLDCPPDAAWDGIRSPKGLREVSAPLVSLEPVAADGFPEFWSEGEHPVVLHALYGIIPMGEQIIDISLGERGGVRIVEDHGRAVSGALAVITRWRHRMAIAPSGDGRTLYRDRLEFSAGLATPVVWIGLWLFWQWRARGLQRLAPRWARRAGSPS
jgi:hypothetical protein